VGDHLVYREDEGFLPLLITRVCGECLVHVLDELDAGQPKRPKVKTESRSHRRRKKDAGTGTTNG
jgi:hypothetical protein